MKRNEDPNYTSAMPNMKPRFKYYMHGLPDMGPIAFYSMKLGSHDSDVSGETLLKHGYPIPPTPTFSTWYKLKTDKRRCGYCWAAVRGLNDLDHHMQNVHFPVFEQSRVS